jgi:hypothetical protein
MRTLESQEGGVKIALFLGSFARLVSGFGTLTKNRGRKYTSQNSQEQKP